MRPFQAAVLASCCLPACPGGETARPAPEAVVALPASEVAPPTPAPPTNPPPPVDLTPPADAVELRPGVRWRKERQGTASNRPEEGDRVRFHRITWGQAGEVLESTYANTGGQTLALTDLPPSYRAVVPQLAISEQATFWVDASVDGPQSPRSIHRVELLDIVPGKRFARLADDVSHAPPDARSVGGGVTCTSASGGTGKRSPKPRDRVRTLVDCYRPDGRFFDGNARGDGPSEGPLSGLTDALRPAFATMTAGADRRCWIGAGTDVGLGAPADAPLVCDLKLLALAPGQ